MQVNVKQEEEDDDESNSDPTGRFEKKEIGVFADSLYNLCKR